MGRYTSYNVARGKAGCQIEETISGRGEKIPDALQHLLDKMERRVMEIRLELMRMRGERP